MWLTYVTLGHRRGGSNPPVGNMYWAGTLVSVPILASIYILRVEYILYFEYILVAGRRLRV